MKLDFGKLKELKSTVKPVKSIIPKKPKKNIPEKLEKTDIKKKYIGIGVLNTVFPFVVSSLISIYNEIMSKGKKK